MAARPVKLPHVHSITCTSILLRRNISRSDKFAEDFLVKVFFTGVPLILITYRNGCFGNFHDVWKWIFALSSVQTPFGSSQWRHKGDWVYRTYREKA
jgi:hypothetical protein